MRCIITMGGLLLSFALIILIHAAIVSDNIRENETKKATGNALEKAVETAFSKLVLEDITEPNNSKKFFQTNDGAILEMNQNNYSDFVISQVHENERDYAVGICYESSAVRLQHNGSVYSLIGLKDGTALYFKVPMEELLTSDFCSVMTELNFEHGEVFAETQSLLYSNVNLYVSNTLALEKNLLSDKEILLVNSIYAEVLQNINSDSTVTVDIFNTAFEKGNVDLCVKEVVIYPNGREGMVSCRKSIGCYYE